MHTCVSMPGPLVLSRTCLSLVDRVVECACPKRRRKDSLPRQRSSKTQPPRLRTHWTRCLPAQLVPAACLCLRRQFGIIAELRGVMNDLHVGRAFLFPPALPANAAIWDQCSDKEVTSTLSFLRQELLQQQKR